MTERAKDPALIDFRVEHLLPFDHSTAPEPCLVVTIQCPVTLSTLESAVCAHWMRMSRKNAAGKYLFNTYGLGDGKPTETLTQRMSREEILKVIAVGGVRYGDLGDPADEWIGDVGAQRADRLFEYARQTVLAAFPELRPEA